MVKMTNVYSWLNRALLWIEGPFLKTALRNWQSIVIIVLCLILAWSLNIYSDQKETIQEMKASQFWKDSFSSANLKVWKDKYNKEHVRAENMALERGEMIKYADSLARIAKVKPKNVTSVSQTVSKVDTGGKPTTNISYVPIPCPPGDSVKVIKAIAFQWPNTKDSVWLTVKGVVGEGDTLTVTINDTLTRIDYSKKSWLLGKRKYYTDINHSNPYIKTTGYKGITLKPTNTRWSVGPFIGAGYTIGQPIDWRRPQIQIGASLQYSLFKF